jgi:hypothetical protein
VKRALPILCLCACAQPQWLMQVSPTDPLLDGLLTSDGCALTWSSAAISVASASLERSDGVSPADISPPWAGDVLASETGATFEGATTEDHFAAVLLQPGPPPLDLNSDLTSATLEALHAADASLWLEGTINCENATAQFAWALPGPSAQRCTRPIMAAANGSGLLLTWLLDVQTLFTSNDESTTLAQPLLQADVNADGVLTTAELILIDPTGLGYLPDADTTSPTLWDLLASRSHHTLRFPEGQCTEHVPLTAETP